ncbi:protein-L-isoaspartate O-methyltransferase family protein [Candidatus Halocynthiibacter alkanivorans]|jgi:protein-L-isoaspartate(D-aspartate) O-methyltransferase|uniref:protein-L-isoaspartate O-methyltransferase family protein n=1 Tax=Candidatus Halocynthiibacter alkanivorans TaxID=2267619 RepID=UPI000DF4B418|nr:protein-L-isoaspartate O-methyltransferase [Candidatus Halocynthiibacter alkanivorans]
MSDYAQRRTVMVDTQVRPSDVTKFPIIEAMLSVPREIFVPTEKREAAYIGENVDLGGNRVVLEPRTLAKMLDALNIQKNEMVLDLGCGLGYSAAVIARMAEAVVAVEEDNLAADAQVALSEIGADNVILETGAISAGAPQHGPYDVITIQGAVENLPDGIISQLKEGGRIGCLMAEGNLGIVRIGYKINDVMNWRFAFNAGAPVLPGFEADREFVL